MRNVCIKDGFDFVIIETDKTPKEIEAWLKSYFYNFDFIAVAIDTPATIGKVLFDTTIDSFMDEAPEASETYYLNCEE